MIKQCFEDPSLIRSMNDVVITLIPKVDLVVNLKQWRPISLCNVFYKTITKILAWRLRPFTRVSVVSSLIAIVGIISFLLERLFIPCVLKEVVRVGLRLKLTWKKSMICLNGSLWLMH